MDVFIDRKEYDSDVFTQLENAENFIKNHIKLSSEIKGLQREDQYEIPLKLLERALSMQLFTGIIQMMAGI